MSISASNSLLASVLASSQGNSSTTPTAPTSTPAFFDWGLGNEEPMELQPGPSRQMAQTAALLGQDIMQGKLDSQMFMSSMDGDNPREPIVAGGPGADRSAKRSREDEDEIAREWQPWPNRIVSI
jgi:hypothetical protein